MKIIGLTGGIASGKSTVSAMLREGGIPVLCADDLARHAVDPGSRAYRKILRAFGPKVVNRDKTINRARLGGLVFSSEAKRKKLNAIVHPEVIRGLKKSIRALRRRKMRAVVVDIPLLFEEKLEGLCDRTIVVYAPETEMKRRLKRRNRLSRAEIESRIAAQLPIEAKKKRADIVIDNTGPLSKTLKQVKILIKSL